MLEKYASSKTKYSKILTYGFAVGGLNQTYENFMNCNNSSYLFNFIKEKSKLEDSYYKIYQELSGLHNKNMCSINFTNLLGVCDYVTGKNQLMNCFTCSATSLVGSISYEKLTDNLLLVSLIGGLINSAIKTILTGFTSPTDFLFGMIASIIGVHVVTEMREDEIDILHEEVPHYDVH
jgi:hypothetical protein